MHIFLFVAITMCSSSKAIVGILPPQSTVLNFFRNIISLAFYKVTRLKSGLVFLRQDSSVGRRPCRQWRYGGAELFFCIGLCAARGGDRVAHEVDGIPVGIGSTRGAVMRLSMCTHVANEWSFKDQSLT